MILVTGGAGFIGANFVYEWLAHGAEPVINLDALTYAGSLHTLASCRENSDHVFVHGDIADFRLVSSLLKRYRPRAIVHFAAESHVDNSITGPRAFVHTNVQGTFELLEAAREYWNGLAESEKRTFRFLHVSTDEVYGSLQPDAPAFSEMNPYLPNSPYSATKAASDHLVRAWHHTYGLPTLITNCSNNYGPYQFPEKLIPLVIRRAMAEQALPVYGDGQQVRDWLYVSDHCSAIRRVLEKGRAGSTYNVGGLNEQTNLSVVQRICSLLDIMRPRKNGSSYTALIEFVADRPGHDRRYAIDARKIEAELGWRPARRFEDGLQRTVAWYVENGDWVEAVLGERGVSSKARNNQEAIMFGAQK